MVRFKTEGVIKATDGEKIDDKANKMAERLKKARQSARLKREQKIGYKKSEKIAERASMYEKKQIQNSGQKEQEHKEEKSE